VPCLSINYVTVLPSCPYEWNMQCEILQLFFNILGDKMVNMTIGLLFINHHKVKNVEKCVVCLIIQQDVQLVN